MLRHLLKEILFKTCFHYVLVNFQYHNVSIRLAYSTVYLNIFAKKIETASIITDLHLSNAQKFLVSLCNQTLKIILTSEIRIPKKLVILVSFTLTFLKLMKQTNLPYSSFLFSSSTHLLANLIFALIQALDFELFRVRKSAIAYFKLHSSNAKTV